MHYAKARAADSVIRSCFTILAVSVNAQTVEQSGEQKDMTLVGHVGLQGRGAYQPNVITYPDGRVIAFAGLQTHRT